MWYRTRIVDFYKQDMFCFGLICFFGCGMRDLSSQTSSTVPPTVEAQNPNHWAAVEFPTGPFLRFELIF